MHSILFGCFHLLCPRKKIPMFADTAIIIALIMPLKVSAQNAFIFVWLPCSYCAPGSRFLHYYTALIIGLIKPLKISPEMLNISYHG